MALVAGGALTYAHVTADSVATSEARWAIKRVHIVVFGSDAEVNAGCFTMQPGHIHTTVFVTDPSYTNYEPVDCYDVVSHQGEGYRVTVTQTWDDVPPPDGSNPLSWLQRIFYKPSYHTWSYIVHRDGSVTTLAEKGKPAPQTYSH